MAQMPTPPASRPGSEPPDAIKEAPVSDSADLLQSLDALLEKYLDLLDQHQKFHTELASRISSGFFSLAQANYTCPPGRRYGADYYDERMKATRRVALQPPAPDSNVEENGTDREDPTGKDASNAIFAVESLASETPEALSATEDESQPERSKEARDTKAEDAESTDSNAQPSESPSPSDSDADPDTALKPKRGKSKPCSSDPIRWFGVLVSPHLRNAQKSFIDVIEGPVPQLASTAFEMRALEIEINRIRSKLEQA